MKKTVQYVVATILAGCLLSGAVHLYIKDMLIKQVVELLASEGRLCAPHPKAK